MKNKVVPFIHLSIATKILQQGLTNFLDAGVAKLAFAANRVSELDEC